MRPPAKFTCICTATALSAAVLGSAVADASTRSLKVTEHSAVAILNDGSAAEQAFIFQGLAKGKDIRHWQTGRGLRATLQGATGPDGHRLRVSMDKPPTGGAGTAGVIYIGLSTRKQLDLATFTTAGNTLQITVARRPRLS
jgi:hypothetical protein